MHEIKEKETSIFYGSLLIEQEHNKYCVLDRSRDTAGFVTQVVPTPTKHESSEGGAVHVDWSQPDDCEEER